MSLTSTLRYTVWRIRPSAVSGRTSCPSGTTRSASGRIEQLTGTDGQVDTIARDGGTDRPSDTLDGDSCHAALQDTSHQCS